MTRLRPIAVGVIPLLFVVLALLAPIAYASPPDPSWVHGVYDGGDFDDVVFVVTAVAGIVEPTSLADQNAAPPPAIWSAYYSDRPASTASFSSLHSRAPPTR